MARKQIHKARVEQLEAMGEDEVFARMSEAGAVRTFCRALWTSEEEGQTPGTQAFYMWLKADEGREARYNWHKRYRAHDVVEETAEAVEGVTPENASAVRTKVEWAKWYSGVLNRDDYGTERKLTIDAGDNLVTAWFDAMERIDAQESAKELPENATEVLEAEVVED